MRVIGQNMLGSLTKMRYNLLKPMTNLGPLCGLFVSENQSPIVTVLVGATLIINITTSYLYLYFNLGDISEVVKAILTSNIYTSSITCLILCAMKRKSYVKVLNEVNSEFEIEFGKASESEKKNMLATNISFMIAVLSMCNVLVLFVIEPFLTESVYLMTPAWYPFDTNNPILFALVFILQSLGYTFATLLTMVTGIYFTNVMSQTCLHFDNLSNSLSMRLEMEGRKCGYSNDVNMEKSFNEFLIKFIERHNQLLRRIKIVDDMFSSFFLIYCIILVPIISAAALEFVSIDKPVSTIHYIKHASVITVGIVLLHGPCKCGSRIIIAQTDVSQALYKEEHLLFSENIKRTLNIINLRAQVPNIITTGGFVSFDMVAYGQALGLFYSIFAMLHHFKTSQTTREQSFKKF